MNHSCVTNTKTIIDSADGGHLLTTLATRDISRGEQITNQVQGRGITVAKIQLCHIVILSHCDIVIVILSLSYCHCHFVIVIL